MTRVIDLDKVEVEHFLGLASGRGQVKLRCLGLDVVLLGQLDPEDARKIARDLMEAAARAEYEQDAAVGLRAAGMPEQGIGLVLHAVRQGELHRMTNPNPEERP